MIHCVIWLRDDPLPDIETRVVTDGWIYSNPLPMPCGEVQLIRVIAGVYYCNSSSHGLKHGGVVMMRNYNIQACVDWEEILTEI